MKLNKGDEIICVDNLSVTERLTAGKTYVVIGKNDKRKIVLIKSDKGVDTAFGYGRFKIKDMEYK